MIDYIDLFILYLSLLNFKLTLSSIYIYSSQITCQFGTQRHTQQLYMFFVMIFAFDIFDLFVSRVSLEWPGNPNPSYSRPSKLPCICASLCTLWNATLYTDGLLYPSQHHSLGRELEMPPFTSAKQSACIFEIST